MRFDHASTAERVATALGQTWVAEPSEVTLPEALIDLTVSQHFDVVVVERTGGFGAVATRRPRLSRVRHAARSLGARRRRRLLHGLTCSGPRRPADPGADAGSGLVAPRWLSGALGRIRLDP